MKTTIKVFFWLPRILCMLAILFISLFAADALEHGATIWEKMGALFIHLIPSFVLLAFLVIAWKWERIGGVSFILIGMVFTPIIFMHNYGMNESLWMSFGIIMSITFPFILVGILFLISYWLRKKHPKMVI